VIIYAWKKIFKLFFDYNNHICFPLFIACRDIIKIIKDHENLDEDRGRYLFASCARTLDEIVYKHGSIIHLKRVDDLSTFLSLKEAIDENLEFVEQRNWAALKDRFKSNELKEVVSYANILLSRCKEEVKGINKLPAKEDLDDLEESCIYVVDTHNDFDNITYWALGYVMGKGIAIIGYYDGKTIKKIPSDVEGLISISDDIDRFVKKINRALSELKPKEYPMDDDWDKQQKLLKKGLEAT
jgi:hypothetical protein